MTQRRRHERGAAAVEFALVMPLLLLLVFGIVDFGMMIQDKTSLANAAREGARNGSLSRDDAIVKQTVADSLGVPVATLTSTKFSVVCKKADGTTCPVTAGKSTYESGGSISVTVKDHYSWKTPIASMISAGSGVDLSKTVSMRVE